MWRSKPGNPHNTYSHILHVFHHVLDAPVIASYPHMLWANESYSSTVIGLEPDQEKHQTFVVLEPVSVF